MANRFFEDGNGHKSSKRLAGAFCLLIGSIMKLSLFYYGINHITAISFEQLNDAVDTMIYVGAALIGSGLLEVIKSGKK